MPEENTEVVETTEAPESTETEAAESTTETTTEPAEASTEAPAWAGEMDKLGELPWYSGLDEATQAAVRAGIEGKVSNYDKGYQEKFRTLADERKAWQTEQATSTEKLRKERADLESLLYGEGDPMATLKAQHEESLTAATTERDQLQAQLSEYQNTVIQEQADGLATWIETEASDLYADDDAFTKLTTLIGSGIEAKDAVVMVRATMAPPAAEPSKQVAATSRDSRAGRTESATPMDWKEAIRLEKQR